MNGWLIDKSALWKLGRSPDLDEWLNRINRGLVGFCLATRLEVAASAHNGEQWPAMRRRLLDPLVEVSSTPRSDRIAAAISDVLVEAGLHRTVSAPDILIASIATAERLTVLHDDRGFDRIREVYGEPSAERLRL